MPQDADPRRHVPRTDALLAEPALVAVIADRGREAVRAAVRVAQQQVRDGTIGPDEVVEAALAALPGRAGSLTPVLNATGVVLHTNLGRAPLSVAAVKAVAAATGYVDVELDLATGVRARRGRGVLDALLRAVPEAQAALVVNNGAAALVLATTALSCGKEVVVSRGEMVEIGDGFRLHELIASCGARLREVGTTNRTHLTDYAEAVGAGTGCILKVHPSNFRMDGFTAAASVSDLATLGVPVVHDIGSGLLAPDALLPAEPDARTSLRDGAAVVTCSGDKLVGGPQAGLVLGRADVVERLRRHPLARAVRADKTALAALEATLTGPTTPTWAALRAEPGALRRRCETILARLPPALDASVVPSEGVIGGGGAPGRTLPGWAVALPVPYAARLRLGDPAIVARTERGRCLVDLRCIPDSSDLLVAQAISLAWAEPVTDEPDTGP